MPSESTLPRVLAEGASELVGLGPPAQLVEPFVAKDRLAMDGVLKSFDYGLQTLYAHLKNLHRALPTNVRLRLYRLCAWRLAALAWGCHCSRPSALCGVAREEE
jgi:hypothetical protein